MIQSTDNDERRAVQTEQLSNLKKQLDNLTKEVKEFKQFSIKIAELDHKLTKHMESEDIDDMKKDITTLRETNVELTNKVNELLLAKITNQSEHQVLINQLNDTKPKVEEIYDILLVWKGFSKMIGWISDNAKKVSAIIVLIGSICGGVVWTYNYLQTNFITQEKPIVSK